MPGLNRSVRARFLGALWGAGLLLCLTGLTAVSVADVSFGHEHLAGGHVVYHFHLNFGPHEHLAARLGHGHLQARGHGRDTPAPSRRETPRRSATIATALTLMPPLSANVLAAPPELLASSVAALALPPTARPVAQPALPRGPPSADLPGCWKKGSFGCRS